MQTLLQFNDWALSQGSVGKYNDGQFVGQCVSLINQYCYRVLGVPAGAWGDAVTWANDNNANRQYFDKVGSPQAGDVGVMGANFGGGYGHIFIYLSSSTILEQNGAKPLKVTTGNAYSNPIAILRPKNYQGGSMSADAITKAERDRLFINGQGYAPDDNFAVGAPLTVALDALEAGADYKANHPKLYQQMTYANPANGDARDAQGWFNAYAERDQQLKAAEAALGKQTGVNPDSILITRKGFNGLFDVIKSFLGGK